MLSLACTNPRTLKQQCSLKGSTARVPLLTASLLSTIFRQNWKPWNQWCLMQNGKKQWSGFWGACTSTAALGWVGLLRFTPGASLPLRCYHQSHFFRIKCKQQRTLQQEQAVSSDAGQQQQCYRQEQPCACAQRCSSQLPSSAPLLHSLKTQIQACSGLQALQERTVQLLLFSRKKWVTWWLWSWEKSGLTPHILATQK